jgi:hypothetical protein
MNPKYKTNWGLISTLARVMELSTARGDSVHHKVSHRALADADSEIYFRVNDAKRPFADVVRGNHADHPNLNEFLKC